MAAVNVTSEWHRSEEASVAVTASICDGNCVFEENFEVVVSSWACGLICIFIYL